MAKSAKKDDQPKNQVSELTADLQRTRADFENFRKRVDGEKAVATANGETKTILKMLPVLDTIDRATANIPEDIAEHPWVQGVAGLTKQLNKALTDMNLVRIDSNYGTEFDPEQHQAVQFDEDAKGSKEVIAEELQPGYLYGGSVVRPALVKVTRK